MKFEKALAINDLHAQREAFSQFIIDSGYEHKSQRVSIFDSEAGGYVYRTEVASLPDSIVDEAVAKFEQWYTQHLKDEAARELEEARRIAAEDAAAEAESKAKKLAIAAMLITSGFSFEGYSITKYSGYISGDDVIEIDRGRDGWFQSATQVGPAMMESLVDIRRNALQELKEAAHALGCNAVIGVDFDYLVMDPETVNASGGTLYMPYVLGVTANGNAVVIQKSKKSEA